MNVVYLVLVFGFSGYREISNSTAIIPQANIKQCEINRKSYKTDESIKRAYCIVGVK